MEPATSSPTLKFGPYLVDLPAGEIRKNGSRIRLQEKPLRLLVALAEKQGEVVTREELKKRLWPDDTFVDFETGLNTAVSKLRGALSDTAEKARFVETIPRRGYRFLVPVEFNGHRASAQIEAEPPEAGRMELAPAESATVMPIDSEPARSWQRSVLWFSVAALVAAICVGGYWVTHGSPALSFHSRDTVLITDFENQTGDLRFDNALGNAFVVSIEQSRYANVVPRPRLDEVLARMEKPATERITPALGREICQRESIRALIAAGITRTGEEYELTAQLIDPQTGETVRAYTQRSNGEDHILDALDSLSRKMRGALGESLYEIHKAGKLLPEVTTSSLSALQKYADGSVLWDQGTYKDAVTLYKGAIADDPDFAMAHAALGGAYYSYYYNEQNLGQQEYEKALTLRDRMTDREHMIIETRLAQDQDHLNDAEQLFAAYLSRYPDDVTMRSDYANLLRRHNQQQAGIDQYKLALQSAPHLAYPYIGIATAYKSLGHYPEALQAYSKAFENEPQLLTSGNINREYGFALVANGEDGKAAQVFSALLTKPDLREVGMRSLAFLDLYHGRYNSARARLQESLASFGSAPAMLSRARILYLLAGIAEGKGDVKGQLGNLGKATSLITEIKDVPPKVVFGATLCDAYARSGFLKQAEQIAANIEPIADSNSTQQMGRLHFCQGEIALGRGDSKYAVELFKQSATKDQDSTAFSMEALAYAYEKSGDLDNAIATYEQMFKRSEISFGWEAQQRWIAARFNLALDYASQGNKDRARETLGALLSLWKDADPDLILLKQARIEYAKLQ